MSKSSRVPRRSAGMARPALVASLIVSAVIVAGMAGWNLAADPPDPPDKPWEDGWGGIYWTEDKYEKCVDSDGKDFDTPKPDPHKCKPESGSCIKNPDDYSDMVVNGCYFCFDTSGEWQYPQYDSDPRDLPSPPGVKFYIASGKVLALAPWGRCTKEGAATGDQCVECPLYFCVKARLYHHGDLNGDGTIDGQDCPPAAAACKAARSKVVAVAAKNLCIPPAAP